MCTFQGILHVQKCQIFPCADDGVSAEARDVFYLPCSLTREFNVDGKAQVTWQGCVVNQTDQNVNICPMVMTRAILYTPDLAGNARPGRPNIFPIMLEVSN